jgi:toxin CcdB
LRQFDVYENPSERWREIAPFVAVPQSHLLAATPTIIVAPLLLDDGVSGYSEASVTVAFQGGRYIPSALELAAIDASTLRKLHGSPLDYEDAIRRALDRLFTGF